MRVVGRIADKRVNESSGLAVAQQAGLDGFFWTHNDSGDSPRLFLINNQGSVFNVVPVEVPRAVDWEDMCSFVLDGQPMLLIGDTGNNTRKRRHLTLWLLPEPAYDRASSRELRPTVTPTRRINFTYADGPQDCESVAFDPTSNTIVLITKVDPRRTPVGKAGVYLLPLGTLDESLHETNGSATAHSGGEAIVLERVADLSLRVTVAADISPDGRRCVVGTYGDAWQYVRGEGETWAEAFKKPPTQIALGPRGQSEAIAFGSDGVTLRLTAEGVGKPMWEVAPVDR